MRHYADERYDAMAQMSAQRAYFAQRRAAPRAIMRVASACDDVICKARDYGADAVFAAFCCSLPCAVRVKQRCQRAPADVERAQRVCAGAICADTFARCVMRARRSAAHAAYVRHARYFAKMSSSVDARMSCACAWCRVYKDA